MKRTVKIQLLLLFAGCSFSSFSQSVWQSENTQSSQKAIYSGSCPVYNVEDPELNIIWEQALGIDGDNYATDIAYAPDSNYIMLIGNYGAHLTKYNKAGELLWQKKLLVSEDTLFITHQFIQVGDYYYFAGYWDDYYNRKFGVMKTDLEGNKVWLKLLFKESASKKASYVNPTLISVENTNLLIGTSSRHKDFVTKYDSSLNKVWEVSNEDLGYENQTLPLDLFELNEGYLFKNRSKFWKVGINGEIIISDTLRGGNHNRTIYYKENFYCAGGDAYLKWIRKYSSDFSLEDEYIQDESKNQRLIVSARDIKVLRDGSILVFYDFEYAGTMDGDMHTNINLLHLDKNLNCLSTSNFAGNGSQRSNELLIDSNDDYILFGDGYYQYEDRNMVLLAKIEHWPLTSIQQNEKFVFEVLTIPNPVINSTKLLFNEPLSGEVEVVDSFGKLIFKQVIRSKSEINLDMSNYQGGVYFIRLKQKNSIYSKKIIKI